MYDPISSTAAAPDVTTVLEPSIITVTHPAAIHYHRHHASSMSMRDDLFQGGWVYPISLVELTGREEGGRRRRRGAKAEVWT